MSQAIPVIDIPEIAKQRWPIELVSIDKICTDPLYLRVFDEERKRMGLEDLDIVLRQLGRDFEIEVPRELSDPRCYAQAEKRDGTYEILLRIPEGSTFMDELAPRGYIEGFGVAVYAPPTEERLVRHVLRHELAHIKFGDTEDFKDRPWLMQLFLETGVFAQTVYRFAFETRAYGYAHFMSIKDRLQGK